MSDLRAIYRRHLAQDPRRERGFLSALGFTTAFATARAITHSIRAGIGPFHNNLKDDYWDQQGRKSIDAVAIFGGLLTMGFLGQDALRELLGLEQRAQHEL